MTTLSLPQFDGFDWSGGNAEKNQEKHRVSPLEAEQIFFHQPLICAMDIRHSQTEPRRYALGQTDGGRLLFIAFAMRGTRIRVISARDMSRKERAVYQT